MSLRQLFLPVLAGLALGLVAEVSRAETVVFPRRPAISPAGDTIVFTAQGDLWRVDAAGGRAQRLTAHPAYDRDPVFSPDGEWLAFASDREAGFDVYVMPARGGRPERLTFAPSTDIPQDWSDDGRDVLFAAARPWRYPVRTQIQRVSRDGGTPTRLLDLFASEIAVHPDGSRQLLTIGASRFGRVGYRGTYQSDIWLHAGDAEPVRLTDGLGYDTDPMWGPDDAVFWRGEDDRTGAFNIWRQDADGGDRRRLTDFTGEGVRNARLSRDGSRLVCEAGEHLWVLDTADERPRRLEIEIAADQVVDPVTHDDVTGDADELAVAAGGEELAMVVRGEIVLVNRELEGRATVVLPSPWRESGLAFRPGSADTLLVVSDRAHDDGVPYSRIGLVVSDDPEQSLLRLARRHRVEWLTPVGLDCADAHWSPDGQRIAYRHGWGKLAVMAADGGDRRILHEGWDDPQVAWSPDSRWLAWAVAGGEDFNTDVWLVPLEGGEPVNVSQHPDYDTGPVWSEDGTMLAWNTRRFGNQADVVFCYLTRALDERSQEEWKIWEKIRDDAPAESGTEDDEEAGEDGADEDAASDVVEPISIDVEDIHLRVRRLTSLPGDERVVAIHPQGDRIAFAASIGGERDLHTVDRFGEDRKSLTEGGAGASAAHLGPDGKTVWLLEGGRPARVALDGGKLETTSFRARLTTDRPALRRQVVEETYRVLRDRFYAPDMHGIDWEAQREKALRLAAAVDHDADFADAMNIMLRSLNASHMGYYPGGRGGGGKTGWLGLEFDPDHGGAGVRVAAVVPHGPADRAEDGLRAGDVILSVDGDLRGRGPQPLRSAGGGRRRPRARAVRARRRRARGRAAPGVVARRPAAHLRGRRAREPEAGRGTFRRPGRLRPHPGHGPAGGRAVRARSLRRGP